MVLLAGIAASASAVADTAAQCDLPDTTLFAGEIADIVACGEVDGMTASVSEGVKLIYQQPLQECGVDDRRPGLHLAVSADAAGSAEIVIRDTDDAPLCTQTLRFAEPRPSPEPDWLNSMPADAARFITVDGIRTRYFEQGKGQPLVLVHGGQAGGANNSAEKWEQNFPSLAQHFRVIAIDRLAQGDTDNLPDAPGTDNPYADYFAADAAHLQAFIRALDLRDAILVGHSQGGWPVTRAALDMPALISCVVNVDTVMVPFDMQLMGEAMQFLMYTSRHLHPPTGPTVHSARRGMKLRYPTDNNITAAKAQRLVDQHFATKTAAARDSMNALRMTPRHNVFRALKEQAHADIAAGGLSARSVVIWGELDPQVPLGLGEQFNAMLEAAGVDTRLAVIEGTGHAPFIERPDVFNRLVREHCAGD
ncbi:MAG: alpha/beta hydrolase [Gammaproteobacteria bacterium]|nr:alpha/beta hydrolase [Gammaproteobacteria bacterium]